MSVMNCLAELHAEPDLKLTLKFEVEVLCKALNIELAVNILIFFIIYIICIYSIQLKNIHSIKQLALAHVRHCSEH